MMRSSLLAVGLLVAGTSVALAQDESPAPLSSKPAQTFAGNGQSDRTIEIKFRHGTDVRLRQGAFTSALGEIRGVNEYILTVGGELSRLFQQPEAWLDAWRQSGEARSGKTLHDLNLFYRLELEQAGPIGEICDALNRFEIVEIAYPSAGISDPTLVRLGPPPSAGALIAPDFESQQGYRQAAPLGVDADYGQRFPGGRGVGITIVDVETGWTDDHEDISHKALGNFVGLTPAPYPWDHGTAVLGELVGEDNGTGVVGIVSDSDVLLSSHLGSSANVPTAIANAAAAANPGDVVVLEVQCFAGPPAPHPCEYSDSIFATVQTATANGIHVFAASGNGNNDLDSASYGGKFDKNVRDSGSVMVGASDGSSLNKASFSNYGSRLDAHGWGFNVVTSGYGDLWSEGFPTEPREYTAGFSGTSSATPIVTGAGIQLAAIHRQIFGSDIDPFTLRSLLTSTGTPQGSGGQIGPRPDVQSALAQLNVPRITVGGNPTPGGFVQVDSDGAANDPYCLLLAYALAPVPVPVAPFGTLFLNAPFFCIRLGTLDGTGHATDVANLPNNPNLIGKVGYFQELQTFTSAPGVGGLSNWASVTIQ
ncbi:MAG: S8 family serine peptidase [Planctomycetota bacterium]